MKTVMSLAVVTLILQVMVTVFILGFHVESVHNAFQLGVDSVPVAPPVVTVTPVNPLHWWFGTTDLEEARKRLCSRK